MVISAIWSIIAWDRFPYTKIYLIYGQISDIWSEIQIKAKTKASHCVSNQGYFHSRRASEGSGNPVIGFFRASTPLISYQPFQPISKPFQPLSTVISDIWSYCLYGQFFACPTTDHISNIYFKMCTNNLTNVCTKKSYKRRNIIH